MTAKPGCRICGGTLHEFFDFGRQPIADAFVDPAGDEEEFFHRLAVAMCTSCTMVQLLDDVPRERMFRTDYPYLSSLSTTMRDHFERTARHFLDTELRDPGDFLVEFGSNDGIMLDTVRRAGRRHLGVEPSTGVAEAAATKGIRVRNAFFEEESAAAVAAEEGPAKVIYAANTFSHISYVDSVFRGVDALLAPDGVFVFEDPYMADIVERTSFDQIYDEHFYFFSVRSVQAMAAHYGFELVDAVWLPVHGGEIRYTVARRGARTRARPSAASWSARRPPGSPNSRHSHASGPGSSRSVTTCVPSWHVAVRRAVRWSATAPPRRARR